MTAHIDFNLYIDSTVGPCETDFGSTHRIGGADP